MKARGLVDVSQEDWTDVPMKIAMACQSMSEDALVKIERDGLSMCIVIGSKLDKDFHVDQKNILVTLGFSRCRSWFNNHRYSDAPAYVGWKNDLWKWYGLVT